MGISISKIEIFVYKRVLIFLPVLMIIILAPSGHKLMLMLGLAMGSLLSILKFRLYSAMFWRILDNASIKKPINASVRSITLFMPSQLMLFPLLYMALKLNGSLFAGVAGGILIVPSVVFMNSITELTGITHNSFQ